MRLYALLWSALVLALATTAAASSWGSATGGNPQQPPQGGWPQQQNQQQTPYQTTHIPKHIFMLWDKGWHKAPRWQSVCLWSWHHDNPTYTVHALNLKQADDLTERRSWINDDRFHAMEIQAKSDVLRVLLLAKYGGVWADSSVASNGREVSEILFTNKSRSIFTFVRHDPKAQRSGINPWITSWFLAAPKDSYVMQTLRAAMIKFWNTKDIRRQYAYFWLHQLVSDLTQRDSRFAAELDAVHLPSADGPHCFTNSTRQPMFKRCNQNAIFQRYERFHTKLNISS